MTVAIQFSQSSLQDYVDCARRFELRYLLRLKYPAVEAEPILEHERHIEMGDQFHRLVHQHTIGVPVDRLTSTIADDTLKRWWENYLQYGLKDVPVEERYPEWKLFTSLEGHRLIAKYDLIAFDKGERFVIMDWKTSHHRPRRDVLAKRLQTLVYCYVLVEAGRQLNGGTPIQPEQVEMIYWFPEYPQQPDRFEYDREQHEQAKTYLNGLIREISFRSHFELTPDTRHCRYCNYRSLCERGVDAGDLSEYDTDKGDNDLASFNFDQIAEVEF